MTTRRTSGLLALALLAGAVPAHADDGPLPPAHAVGTGTADKVVLVASMPILYAPAAHFYFGLGPTFSTDLTSSTFSGDSSKITLVGAQSVIGGWF